ncbi:hypothetical protein MnBA_40490 [Marinobacterium sp. BA1]
MPKTLRCIVMATFLSGCDAKEVGQSLAETYQLPAPTVSSIPDGRGLNLGDRAGTVVGTDRCNNGFGDSYACWLFSLEPGTKTWITLSDGTREPWKTVDAGEGRIYLERPNGFRVSDRLPMNGFEQVE